MRVRVSHARYCLIGGLGILVAAFSSLQFADLPLRYSGRDNVRPMLAVSALGRVFYCAFIAELVGKYFADDRTLDEMDMDEGGRGGASRSLRWEADEMCRS